MTESISVLEVFHRLSGGEERLDDTQLLILAVSLSVHFVLNKVYSFTSFSVNLFQDKSEFGGVADRGSLRGPPLNHQGTKITPGKTHIEVTVKENFYLEV